jgi:hypothetical protein
MFNIDEKIEQAKQFIFSKKLTGRFLIISSKHQLTCIHYKDKAIVHVGERNTRLYKEYPVTIEAIIDAYLNVIDVVVLYCRKNGVLTMSLFTTRYLIQELEKKLGEREDVFYNRALAVVRRYVRSH